MSKEFLKKSAIFGFLISFSCDMRYVEEKVTLYFWFLNEIFIRLGLFESSATIFGF